MAECAAKPARVVPVPSDRLWFDPRVIAYSTFVRQNDVPVVGNVNTLLVKPDPTRIAFGWTLQTGGFGGIAVTPSSDPNLFGPMNVTAFSITWYKLFDYFTLVQLDWWGRSTGNCTVRTYEVIRTPQ